MYYIFIYCIHMCALIEWNKAYDSNRNTIYVMFLDHIRRISKQFCSVEWEDSKNQKTEKFIFVQYAVFSYSYYIRLMIKHYHKAMNRLVCLI